MLSLAGHPGERPPGQHSIANRIRQTAVVFGLYYWVAVFVLSSIVFAAVGTDPVASALGKVVHYAISSIVIVAISVVMYALHKRLIRSRRPEESLHLLFLGAFLLALLAAPIWAGLGFLVYTAFTWPLPTVFDLADFGYDMAYGGGLMFGWACLFVNLLFASELSERAARLAAIREEALAAQMRALRYQVNPHFLFNTLNSVDAMIGEGETAQAQRMVLSLSTFLRTTLELDPFHDVSLEEELALQQGYLEIERERFSDRMTVAFTIEPGVGAALVPSLILQPLVENAVKHGVSAARGQVGIKLRAQRNGEQLVIEIENDMPESPRTDWRPVGTRVGLRNVAERLEARFGDQGRLEIDRGDARRFRARIEMPWRTA